MEWRKVNGFSAYEVSEHGNVRRLTRGGRRYPVGYVLTAKSHPRGYLTYSLVHDDGRPVDILAHRLVAFAFLGAPPSDSHEVAHNDGNKTSNHWTNLRWATSQENQSDRKAHGTYVAGDSAYSRKLSADVVRSIRSEYASHGNRYRGGAVTYKTLAEKHGISQAQVSRIVNGKQWT